MQEQKTMPGATTPTTAPLTPSAPGPITATSAPSPTPALPEPALVVDAPIPSHLWVADKPPLEHGVATQVSAKEFEATHRFKYSEGAWRMPGVASETLPDAAPEHMNMLAEAVLKRNVANDFIVAKISDGVGVGLFARRMFKAGEVVLGYMGVHHKPGASSESIYSLGGTATHSSIDASKIGGLARFIQHMPTSPHQTLKRLNSYRTPTVAADTLHTTSDGMIIDTLGIHLDVDSISKLPEITLELLAKHLNDDMTEWMMSHNEYFLYDYDDESEIAWANVTSAAGMLVDKNIRVQLMVATRNIAPGEQLGFNYGTGYWLSKNCIPKLFTKRGGLLASNRYHRKFAMLAADRLNETGQTLSRHTHYYAKQTFIDHDTPRQFPVCLGLSSRPVSYFVIRQQMIAQGAASSDYSTQPLNSAAIWLQKDLADLVTSVAMYRWQPDSENISEQLRADVVLTTDTFDKWKILHALFEPIKGFCMRFEGTLEVVVQGTNQHTDRLQEFFKTLVRRKSTVVPRPNTRSVFTAVAATQYFFAQPGRPAASTLNGGAMLRDRLHPDPEVNTWMHFNG